MSQHRRLTPAGRVTRRRRIPAYQVRHRAHSHQNGDDPSRHERDAAASSNGADIRWSATGDGVGDTEAFEPIASAPSTVAVDGDQTEDDDYADYLRSVEEAAARGRHDQTASIAGVGAGSVAAPPRSSSRLSGGRPRRRAAAGAGSGAPPRRRGRGRAGHPERQPDPRPLLRRPKTWLIAAAVLVGVVVIAALLWTLNLVLATYDAYNTMHVEPTPRPVFQVNPEGTPVPIPTEEVAATLPDWDSGDPFNILLLGVDNRDGEDEPIRSDTMIVVRVDPTARAVTMMNIPRDLWVYIPGFREDKINAAYPLGEFEDVPGGGVALAAQTIEANFNIRIHYFVTVDFTGFRNIVDTMGGVVVDVPAAIKDDQYPNESYGLTRVYFPTGLQHLDGTEALRYVRTRHGDNDIARGMRQQQVLLAIREQAISLGLITRAESLIRDTGDAIRTDLNFNQLLALANLGRQIESSNITRVNLWEEGLIYEHWPESEDDPFYFEADWDAVWGLATELFSSTAVEGSASGSATPTPTNATPIPTDGVEFDLPVVVRNASTTDLIATGASNVLKSTGYLDVTPANAVTVEELSLIYYPPGADDTARHIAAVLAIDSEQVILDPTLDTILVVLGEDFTPISTR